MLKEIADILARSKDTLLEDGLSVMLLFGLLFAALHLSSAI